MNLDKNFLISSAKVDDYSLKKSVILMYAHDRVGSIGWMTNRKLDEVLAWPLSEGLGLDINIPLYYGGPKSIGSAFLVHSNDFSVPGTKHINDYVSVSRDRVVIDILNMGLYPEKFKFFIGCCSWSIGQLENEINSNHGYWHQVNYSEEIMWEENDNIAWTMGVRAVAEKMTGSLLRF